jgi:hypothetical protein
MNSIASNNAGNIMAKHGKTKNYSKQHFVAKCYTKSWCDPESINNPMLEPFIWQFDRDGSNARAKSPVKLFTETDIYTLPLPDGGRDLKFEHGFQQVENMFAKVRKLRVEKRKPICFDDATILHFFAATAHARTAAYRDHHRRQFAILREKVEALSEGFASATEEQKMNIRRTPSISVGSGESISIDSIKMMEDFPIQQMLGPTLKAVLPVYERMSMAILCTDDDIGFITSDNPVTWFDPNGYKRHPLQRSPGLMLKDIEVTLPLTPNHCLLLTHNANHSGYIDIPKDILDRLNRRHVQHCHEIFISKKNAVNEIWFQQLELPEDAWEKRFPI